MPHVNLDDTFTGPDNIARSCEVKTALGKLNRPAVKLMHIYPKPTSRLELGCVGPEDVNTSYWLRWFYRNCKIDSCDLITQNCKRMRSRL